MERGLAIDRQPVHILTTYLQLAGELEVIGSPLLFLNDPDRDDMVMRDVRVAPLIPSGPFKSLSRPLVTIRRTDVELIHFSGPEARESVRLLAREENRVIYTPIAIVRATFHLPAEAPEHSFLASLTGDIVAVSQARIFWLHSLPMPFPEQCDLLMIKKDAIQMYHPA